MQSVPYLLEIELNNEITSCKAEISHETKENFSDDKQPQLLGVIANFVGPSNF